VKKKKSRGSVYYDVFRNSSMEDVSLLVCLTLLLHYAYHVSPVADFMHIPSIDSNQFERVYILLNC